FGDHLYDFLAPCIYEGEGEMLGLAFFKSLVKHHGMTFFEPIGKALQRARIKSPNLLNPLHAWALRREMAAYARWRGPPQFRGTPRQTMAGMEPPLDHHFKFAPKVFRRGAAGNSRPPGQRHATHAVRQ